MRFLKMWSGVLISNCKPAKRLQFEKEETGSEDKRLRAWRGDSFRRGRFRRASGGPIFSLAREKIGEKRVLGRVWCILPLNSGKSQCFRRRSTRYSPHKRLTTRRLIRGVPNLRLVAVEYLLSIEGADQVCWSAPFCIGFYCFARTKGSPFRGRFPLSGGNVPKGQKG